MASELLDEPGPDFDHCSEPGLDVRIEREPAGVVLRAEGEIDMASVPALKSCLDHVMADSFESLVVDLSRVTFMDSTGLATLAIAYQLATQSSQAFCVRNAMPTVERLFRITGLDGLLAAPPA